MNAVQANLGVLCTGAVDSLGVVLGQEMQRFNRLLQCMSATLQRLGKALKVTAVLAMTAD